jgi:hypothetical protein
MLPVASAAKLRRAFSTASVTLDVPNANSTSRETGFAVVAGDGEVKLPPDSAATKIPDVSAQGGLSVPLNSGGVAVGTPMHQVACAAGSLAKNTSVLYRWTR